MIPAALWKSGHLHVWYFENSDFRSFLFLKKKDLIWTIFKVFIEFVTLSFMFFFWPRGMWDLSSGPGIEPVCPALKGKVLTTGLPAKSHDFRSF